jgi:hypothetical protein
VGETFALSEDSGEHAHTCRWPLAARLSPLARSRSVADISVTRHLRVNPSHARLDAYPLKGTHDS